VLLPKAADRLIHELVLNPDSLYSLPIFAVTPTALALKLRDEPAEIGAMMFVDQDMIEAAAEFVGELRHRDRLSHIEQQIVVIQAIVSLLGFAIPLKSGA